MRFDVIQRPDTFIWSSENMLETLESVHDFWSVRVIQGVAKVDRFGMGQQMGIDQSGGRIAQAHIHITNIHLEHTQLFARHKR